MNLARARRRAVAPNLSALIDIVFILVIFVVLGASFQRVRALEVALPEAQADAPPEARQLAVTVRPDGGLELQGRAVAPEALQALLTAARPAHDAVLVLADRDAALHRVVAVLDAARGAGFAAVSVAADRP